MRFEVTVEDDEGKGTVAEFEDYEAAAEWAKKQNRSDVVVLLADLNLGIGFQLVEES